MIGSAIRRYRIHGLLFATGLVMGVAAYARVGPYAATLDAGLQAALLLLISVTLAATAGAAGAVIGASIAADAARESARITQAEAQADRIEERTARFADRTRELAAQTLASARRYRNGVRKYVYYGAPGRLALGDTFPEVLHELRLIARRPETLQAIDGFDDATVRLMDFEDQGPFDEAGRKEFDVFDLAHGKARIAFEGAIRKELGAEPDLSKAWAFEFASADQQAQSD